MNHATSTHDSAPPAFWGSRYALGLLVLGGIATYLLLSEHRAHFIGALPLLLLLACPLMHVFMHNGHGGHGGHGESHTGHEGADKGADKGVSAAAIRPTGKAGEQP